MTHGVKNRGSFSEMMLTFGLYFQKDILKLTLETVLELRET